MIVEIRETYFRRWEGSVPTQEKKKKLIVVKLNVVFLFL